jgi:hypothetical protein
MGPLLLILSLLSLLSLALNNGQFLLLLGFQLFAMIGIPIIYFLLEKLEIHFSVFRLITYFFAANFALLLGMVRFVRGRQNGIWEPTKR